MSSESSEQSYRVFARKYRPAVFSELIGQDALVRTLSNAIDSGRLAQAWLLTGVRGVGKTTTARILARALNCIGPDGSGGPTITPCGQCEHCLAITEDRHVDVLEMDAASRTGVEDIRELIDGVRYRPVTARYKVYIIDEVHMLSKNAFNALLKTLEEPPPHVKFIFATTETRKVPVTVVSRCQRFDLRRVDAETLVRHLDDILAREGASAEAAAVTLIARAADGSVRDALSILDQAVAHCNGEIGEEQVRQMLGLADRGRVFDLFESLMGGDIKGALDEMGGQYADGVDPIVVLQDLLELGHWITRIKVTPAAAEAITVPEAERRRGLAFAERLAMSHLTRAWQILLKGLGEARAAPDPLAAAEMVLVRLAYAAELPSPADLVRTLRDEGAAAATSSTPAPASAPSAATPAPASAPSAVGAGSASAAALAPAVQPSPEPAPEPPPAPEASPEPEPMPRPTSFAEVVELAEARGAMVLATNLRNHVHPVRFEPGRIELRLTGDAPARLANDLGAGLSDWTGERWVAVVSGDEGAPTLQQQDDTASARRIAEAREYPLVKAVLQAFPDAEITGVRDGRADRDPRDKKEEP